MGQALVDAKALKPERRDEPHDHERKRRPEEPLSPVGEERTAIERSATLDRAPSRESTDDEEHAHDLEHPGDRAQGGHVAQDVADLDPVRAALDGGHQPVARDHREDRERTQEVDVAIARRRSVRRHLADRRTHVTHAHRAQQSTPQPRCRAIE